MVIAIIILGVIALGLCVVLMSQHKRVAAMATLEGRLEAREVQLQGKDELLRQKDLMLSRQEEIVTQKNAEIAAKERLLRDAGNQMERNRQALGEAKDEASGMRAELAALRERVAVTESEREKTEKATAEHFRNLANEIFDAQTRRFKENSERRLEEILTPLRTNIDDFRKAVSTAYNDEARERYSLQNEIRNLMELNRTIGKEAQELTRALKGDSKIQGDWGEMILERLLEMSGLQKGCHFVTQATVNADGSKLTGGDGRALRPDVVVYYPDERCVVIDSKVSLSAYIDYTNAAADSPEYTDAAKRHLLSVRRHVAELAEKR